MTYIHSGGIQHLTTLSASGGKSVSFIVVAVVVVKT